jgi:peptide/nickel transport system substrate-binding protein
VARAIRTFMAVLLGCAAACTRSSAPLTPVGAAPARGGTLTASLRSEPATFNRYAPNGGTAATEVITLLTQAKLVRINRATDQVEPWLAEHWTVSADGRTYTLALRRGITFSDGAPFTSADVLFTFRALYAPEVNSVIAPGVLVNGKPLAVTAPDPYTVVVTLPSPFAPGLQLLDNVPILPRHQLDAALSAHTFRDAWGLSTPPGTMVGLGPFVVTEVVPGQRMTLTRNARYWRRDGAGVQLPYLDSIVIEFVHGQDAEMLRLEAGTIDLLSQAQLRTEDIASVRRLRDAGKLSLIDVGTAADVDMLWFNLTHARAAQKTRSYLQRAEFREAISCAIDRGAIVRTVYLGAAEPTYGVVSPGNRTWYAPDAVPPCHDVARAKALLAGLGLVDRNTDGMLEDPAGARVRFSIVTQGGHIRQRVVTAVQEQLRQLGISVDVVALDPPSIFERAGSGDYDAMYFGFQASSLDPANNMDFWLSSGSFHLWNPSQAKPATTWEARIDELMQHQVAASSPDERKRLFAEVQRVIGEHAPAFALVAPKVSVAMNRRVAGALPVTLVPEILWNAETIYVTDRPAGR